MSMETDRIEADVNDSRSRLNDTIEALGSKLSPGQVIDEVLGLAQGQAGQFASNLGRQVRDNPLPTVLIGAGIIALLMQAKSHRNGASDHDDRHWNLLEEARWRTPRIASETQDAFEERLHAAYAKALDLKQEGGEMMEAFRGRIAQAVSSIDGAAHRAGRKFSQAMASAKHKAGDKAKQARHAAAGFYGDSPLAVGAIAMAIGAIVGAATPLSEMERDAFDGAADSAMRTGARLAEKGADFVERTATQMH